MEFEIWVLALLCCAYFAAGFIDSATGGGGLIAVPSLLMAAIPPELALGTNKLVVALSMPAFLITYARGGFVQWRLAAVGSLWGDREDGNEEIRRSGRTDALQIHDWRGLL